MLNTEKHSNELIDKFKVDVPYLNGGLFSPKDIETKNGNVQISDSVWDYVFELLNGYEWVIEEEKGDSTTLTPSILGHIYEKSVIAATQKETGSYYTPEEITTYISKNTIYPYITDKVNKKFGTKYKYIWNELLNKTEHAKEETEHIRYIYFNVLKNLKICDNACGSGAFLIASQQILLPIYWACIKILLNKPLFRVELSKLKKYRNWNYFLKKEIITKNLYGVDIQEGAVEIAKLRLWLSMVSEMELKLEDIEPLPNIDYNLLRGNSLIGYIKLPERWGSTLFDDPQKIKRLLEERQKLINIYRETCSSTEVEQLGKDIERINKKIREELGEMLLNEFKAKGIEITKDEFDKLKSFHWGFEFYDVFNPEKPKEERGFEIEMPYIETKKGKKKVRKYVVPSGRAWQEITSRYYYSEEGNTNTPEIPDILKSKKYYQRVPGSVLSVLSVLSVPKEVECKETGTLGTDRTDNNTHQNILQKFQKNPFNAITEIINGYEKDNPIDYKSFGMPREKLREVLSTYFENPDEVIDKALREGIIYEPISGFLRVI